MRKYIFMLIVISCLTACTVGGSDDSEYGEGLLPAGTPAPDFTISDGTSGGTATLGGMRGNYVLLEFWASWCPDCRSVTTAVKSFHDTFAPRGLVMVGVSFDDDAGQWLTYIADNGMDWIQHREEKPWRESAVATAYSIRWIPTFYLIAPDGTVDFATVDASEMSDTLAVRLP